MDMPFKYGNPILFRTPIWLELPSDAEVAVLIKPLTYSFIISMYEINYMKNIDSTFFKYETLKTILLESVIDTRNAINFPSIDSFIKQLEPSDVKFLYDKLISISTVTQDQLDELDDMLSIQFNPQFSDDSWNCKICQEKKLDFNRGCGFLPEDKRDPSPALPRIGIRRFTQCPISTIDAYVTNKASMCHSLFSEGILPESGGVGEQTEWFIKVALLYKRKIAEAERNALDNQKNKNK